jgi:hypothetical protein
MSDTPSVARQQAADIMQQMSANAFHTTGRSHQAIADKMEPMVVALLEDYPRLRLIESARIAQMMSAMLHLKHQEMQGVPLSMPCDPQSPPPPETGPQGQ